MSIAMRSMQVWAVYALAVGLGLLLVPSLTIGMFGVEPADEVWIRVVGVVAVALDIIYWSMMIRKDEESLRATVYEGWQPSLWRSSQGPWDPGSSCFAVLDCGGATWTHTALRRMPATARSQ